MRAKSDGQISVNIRLDRAEVDCHNLIMARPNGTVEASDSVATPSINKLSPMEGPVDDRAAWLRGATKERDEALRLLRHRFTKDLEAAAQLVGSRNPKAFASQVEYANKLTADYLTESDKLFTLMNRLRNPPRSS